MEFNSRINFDDEEINKERERSVHIDKLKI